MLLALVLLLPHPNACRVDVVDAGCGWPVPLVELRTTHGLRFVSDNAGRIALDAPELFGRPTWFTVIGHGYGVAPDGFGSRGVRLIPTRGGRLGVKVTRTSIARRLGRATGAGLFAESQKLGYKSPLAETGVFGCDTVQAAVYRGKRHWAWGDTTLPGYPLGVFDGTAATTPVEPLRACEPPLAIAFDYARAADGEPRGVARMPGSGPTWITGMLTLPDRAGVERLVTGYTKITPPLSAYRFGLAEWSDAKGEFGPLRVVWDRAPGSPKMTPVPEGHASIWADAADKRWAYFGNPLPTLRCPATYEAWRDPKTWEALTPPAELRSAGGPVVPHSGSVAWSDYRKRYVAVFAQKFGKPSAFGEVWYAESPTPAGPWGAAVKILTHENYTFYNPKVHAAFSADGASLVFEGTYTAEFADRAEPTPRYNYNQVLYRLDLDDARLAVARGAGP